jgi:hypothetical protein
VRDHLSRPTSVAALPVAPALVIDEGPRKHVAHDPSTTGLMALPLFQADGVELPAVDFISQAQVQCVHVEGCRISEKGW